MAFGVQTGNRLGMQNRIKELREAKGLSSRQLAKLVKTSAVQMGRLEKGQCKLTLEWMLRIGKALDAPLSELVDIDFGTATSKYDQPLMETILSSVLQVLEKAKNKPSAKEMAGWVSFIYGTAINNRMDAQEIRELVSTIAKVSKKGIKSPPFVAEDDDASEDASEDSVVRSVKVA